MERISVFFTGEDNAGVRSDSADARSWVDSSGELEDLMQGYHVVGGLVHELCSNDTRDA